MRKNNIYTAIDVGTSKVCTVIGRLDLSGQLEILGVGLVPSRGMKKGMVSNLSEVAEATKESVEQAEFNAGLKIHSANVGLTGSHINSSNTIATLDNRDYDNPVSSRDIKKILKASSDYQVMDVDDSRVLHIIPRTYAVDGHWGIGDPTGMHTSTLAVETHIIQGSAAPIDSLIKAVSQAKVKVKGIMLEPLASAKAILAPEELEMGVVVLDIGGGTSDMAVFLEGNIWHSRIIPVGGFQLTRDIAIAFNTSYPSAEEAKIIFGNVEPSRIDPDDEIELSGFVPGTHFDIKRQDLCSVLRDRVEELVNLVLMELKVCGLDGVPPGGIVITGGSAKVPGLVQMVEEMAGKPVRIGLPRGHSGIPADLQDPSFSTALGLLIADTESNGANEWYATSKVKNRGYLSRLMTRILGLLDSAKHSIKSQIRRFNHE
ncbi:MAG: cell division protein FtsA [Chloroflexi bacterium]|nr:cell division protein FtsA [Chloroflexota bacterium]